MMRRYRVTAVALATACALGVAACGDSGDDGDSGGGSAGAKTIKIMAMGPIEASQFSVPSIDVGARAAVEAINADGGIDGKQLELIVCNDRNDPNVALGCARQAVEEDVAALVGGYTMFEAQVLPVLERAGIPWVGPTALQNTTSDSYWLLGGEGSTMTLAMGQHFAREGCRRIAAIGENVPASKAAIELFEAGVSASGASAADAVYGASNAADWGPVVAAALDDDADCLAFLGSPPNTPKVVSAIAQSGKPVRLITSQSLLPDQAVRALGAAADGTLMTSGYLPFSSDEPGVRRLIREARAIDADVPLDAQLESTYAAVNVLAAAARGLDTVDAETLTEALGRIDNLDTGVGPVVDFTAANPTRAFSRASNPGVFLLEARDGDVVLADPEPVDVTPVFEALARAGQ